MSDFKKLNLLLSNGYCISSIKGIYFAGCEIDLCLSPAGNMLEDYGEETSIFTYSEDLFNYAYDIFSNNKDCLCETL